MRSLSPDFKPDERGLDLKLRELSRDVASPNLDVAGMRERLELGGFAFRTTAAAVPAGSRRFLCVDSSFGKLDLKFHSIYCLHCVSVFAAFTAGGSRDVLVGQGTVPYGSMRYDSCVDVGLIRPYSDTDRRLNLLRVGVEAGFLLESEKSLEGGGEAADYLVWDGSLTTVRTELEGCGGFPEYRKTRDAVQELSRRKVVSMVEDSHATDIAAEVGSQLTNLHLLEYVLRPLEYVVKEAGGFYSVYVKLPGKSLCFNPGGASRPLVVRWEFNYPDFEGDLAYLAGAWSLEDDLLHPQVYPLRIADYLTRKIKVGGVLSSFVRDHGLELEHRDLRSV